MTFSLRKFLKDWMLVIAMVCGVSIYIAYRQIPALHPAGPLLYDICTKVQPTLLFIMLFFSFSKIELRELRLRRWHFITLFVQIAVFVSLSLLIRFTMGSAEGIAGWVGRHRVAIEAAMLCIVCPTATACPVITRKLGGDMGQVVTYTIIVNLAVAVAIPLVIPMIYPSSEVTFIAAFAKILGKVFPLLILPCLLAWIVRILLPNVSKWVVERVEVTFYIWAVGLALAVMMSTRAIFHHQGSIWVLGEICAVSVVACILQFWAGHRLGKNSGSRIEAGQAFGQKNTVFAIWVGYTFMNPIVSVAGGFYSIWHNLYNTLQLVRQERLESLVTDGGDSAAR